MWQAAMILTSIMRTVLHNAGHTVQPASKWLFLHKLSYWCRVTFHLGLGWVDQGWTYDPGAISL